MKTLITAAAATYALVLMIGGCSSKTAVPTSSTQALNSGTSSSSSKLSPQAQATIKFPKASCGDKSKAVNDTWYPVFVDGGDLNTIRHQFCADAVATVRKDTKTPSVQLASFTNRDRASEFAKTVGGDVGQPTYPDSAQAALGCGVVNDPTGTPLNVRRSPNGEILGAFSNGQQVTVQETVEVNDKKWLHVVASSNDGYVFADYITGCDSPTPSADNEPQPQNEEASVEPVTPIDEVYTPTTASSSGGSCNSPDNLDSRGHRCGGRASSVRASSTRTFSTRTSSGRGRR